MPEGKYPNSCFSDENKKIGTLPNNNQRRLSFVCWRPLPQARFLGWIRETRKGVGLHKGIVSGDVTLVAGILYDKANKSSSIKKVNNSTKYFNKIIGGKVGDVFYWRVMMKMKPR